MEKKENITHFKKGEMPKCGKQFSSDYQPDKEVWTEDEALCLFNDLITWFKSKKTNILFDEFLFDNPNLGERPGDIYPALITYLRDKFPSCLKLYENARKIQETRLVKFALHDKINPGMSKFILGAKHGYVERKDVTSGGEAIKPTRIVFKKFNE